VRPIGFSSGAIAYSNFQNAIDLLAPEDITCIELSALRLPEVEPLVNAIGTLEINKYEYVSFHAPSSFTAEQEQFLVGMLLRIPQSWPIILHPDTIHDFRLWRRFGSQLAIENMDLRKASGRTMEELANVFEELPNALMCFDIGHSRQCDTSMTQAYRILKKFRERLRQIHISEVNTASHHDPISFGAKVAFRQVAWLIPSHIPVIIESRVSGSEIAQEVGRAREALPEYSEVRDTARAEYRIGNSSFD
jgi:hypothetical protein